jgi:hypothetical protein
MVELIEGILDSNPVLSQAGIDGTREALSN